MQSAVGCLLVTQSGLRVCMGYDTYSEHRGSGQVLVLITSKRALSARGRHRASRCPAPCTKHTMLNATTRTLPLDHSQKAISTVRSAIEVS